MWFHNSSLRLLCGALYYTTAAGQIQKELNFTLFWWDDEYIHNEVHILTGIELFLWASFAKTPFSAGICTAAHLSACDLSYVRLPHIALHQITWSIPLIKIKQYLAHFVVTSQTYESPGVLFQGTVAEYWQRVFLGSGLSTLILSQHLHQDLLSNNEIKKKYTSQLSNLQVGTSNFFYMKHWQ